MQLAQQLKAAGLDVFPCSMHYDTAKHKWQKHPVTVNREHWAVTAARPIDDPQVQWSGVEVVGVPVPAGVVIIDLDCYKPGVTPEAAAMILGAHIPWEAALLQTTISGGRHYAFRLPEWQVKQGSNLGGPGSGIDTRVAGLGFICTGGGYHPAADGFGALRLACPESLPVLPDECRPVLEKVAVQAPTLTELPTDDERDPETVIAALAFIDPTERDTWRDVGFALKHYFHDDEFSGYEIWDAWSQGTYWHDGCPAGYNSDTQAAQWASFQAVREGATITVGTLFHMAIKGGWQPPARFDTAAAFGPGAAPAETFNGLVERILEEGADSRKTEELLQAITTSGCNDVQAILLRNELKAVMRSAKLLDKDLSAAIDRKTTPQLTSVGSSLYAKNHTDNATLFIQTHYPDGTLIRVDQTWYAYNGKCWEERDDDALDHQAAMAMLPSKPQDSTINGTVKVVGKMVHRANVSMSESPQGLIVYQNGVLELATGVLYPHDKAYLTTKIVPYNYNPHAQCPRWLTFVNEVFSGDQECIALLQEWFGYMISPTYQYQKVLLMLGPKRSGKGTIGNILKHLVGELNYTGCSLTSFADDDFLDSLQHKTVAFSGDTQKTVGRNIVDKVVERIKKISGNDDVDFGRKYKKRLTCKLPTRVILAGNHIPKLFDDSEALAGRLLVLPFEVSFFDRENPELLGELLAEIEGIAMWSLQGLARLNQQQRFTVPAASQAEMEYIAELYSPLRTFITDCCTLGGDNAILSEDLYNAYKAWALETGEDSILARKPFISAFKDASRGHGARYGSQRSVGGRGFSGVTVNRTPDEVAQAFTPKAVK